jgi:hypothetical protein
MAIIERILLHPDDILDGSRPVHATWIAWRNLPTTKVIPMADTVGYKNLAYLDEYDYGLGRPAVGDYLVLGGQTTLACMPNLLNALATHSRVYSGQVALYVDCQAVSPRVEEMYWAINALWQEMQIRIMLFNQ